MKAADLAKKRSGFDQLKKILAARTMQIFISHEVGHKSHFEPLEIVALHWSTYC